MLSRAFAACLLLFALASPLRAYTPESGTWWNPAEGGWGILLEIQDNYIFVTVYSYDVAGNAQWYTANGFLDGNRRFVGQLDAFRNGPCLGCVWREASYLPNAGGPIVIDFNPDDPTRGRLAWGGRSNIPIERYQFYLKRFEDEQELPGVRLELTKTLGEWQSLLDFTTNRNAPFQYFGDIAVLDVLDSDNQGDFVDGCRPSDSLVGECTQQQASLRRAVMEYTSSNGEHILVVDNDASSWAAYFLLIGTNDFEGEVSVYPKGGNPSVFYPVRGHRTASRTFVQGEVGPSKSVDASRPGRAPQALPLAWFNDPAAKSAHPDRAATRAEALQRLQQRLLEQARR